MKKIRSLLAGALALSGTFTIAAVGPAASVSAEIGDLIISEYVEPDGGSCKVIELYNETGATVDLAAGEYSLLKSNNGGTSENTIVLTGSVLDGETYVVSGCDSSGDYTWDQFNGNISHNGDDAYVLQKGDPATIVDSFGRVGEDPGSAWTGGGVTTVNQTLRRKADVCAGDTNSTDAFDPSVEWVQIGTNVWDGIGQHTTTCTPAVFAIDTQPMGSTVAVGATAALTVAVAGGTAPYAYQWYEGATGVTTNAVGTDSDTYTTDPLTPAGDYDFWVRVTDSAGSPAVVDSDTATVTAEVAVAPTLDVATPADVTIDSGDTTTLSVAVTGGTGPLSYQWYEGAAPDDSNPVGSDSATFETPALSDTTNYWVEVSGPGGETGSRTAVVAVVSPCDGSFTLISTIQGSGAASGEVGNVVTVQAVVVGDFQDTTAGTDGDFNGFHVQEEDIDADADPLTSEGIFIYEGSNNVILDVDKGDLVAITGEVAEFNGLTQIRADQIEICTPGVGAPTPAAPVLPAPDGDYMERFEGMSVDFAQDLYINEFYNFDRFGEIVLGSSRLYQPTAVAEPGVAAQAVADANALAVITLDDGRSSQNSDPYRHPNGLPFDLTNMFRGGDTLTNVVGVIDYSFGAYKIQPTGGATYNSVNPREPAPADVGGRLRVLGLNVLNYFNTLDTTPGGFNGPYICGPLADQECRGASTTTERDRQLDKIVATIEAVDPAVAGLMEIENDTVDQAFIDIVTALNDNSAPGTWSYIATGAVGTDVIRQGLIYQPGLVTPVGTTAILDTPAFLTDRNRPAVTQAFAEVGTGEVFVVSANHFKSKSSSCGGGDDDPEQGDCNGTRDAAAAELVRWLDEDDPTGTGDADVVVLGDLNSYDYEDPIVTLTAGGYVDLDKRFSGDEAYSYVFDGQLGYLDYAMASASLNPQVTGSDVWHTNSDEPDLLDYNTDFKTAAQIAIYEANPFRASDHDPVIIGLALDGTAPTVEVEEGSGQADPASTGPIVFDVVFSEDVTGFDETGIVLGGTAGATTAVVTEVDASHYTVSVSGMTADGTVTVSVGADAAIDGSGNGNLASMSTDNVVTLDTAAPTVTVEQTDGQLDPATTEPVVFDVVFSEPVTLSGDGSVILLGGTAAPFAASMTGSGANYTIEITDIGGSGTIEVALAAAAGTDAAGNPSVASTSDDNVVTFDAVGPTVTINQAASQADPATTGPVVFDVVFSEDVSGFTAEDIVLNGTLTGASVGVTGGPQAYTVTVTIPEGASGTVQASIGTGAAADGVGNPSAASTSTDNVVTVTEVGSAGPIDGAAQFVPLSPVRLFDTRASETAPGPKGLVGPQASIDVQVGGEMGVPADAVAVVMNVTVTDTTGPGFVTVYPSGIERPTASSVNIIEAGQTRPNLVTVPLGDDGMVTLYSLGAVNLLADVAGYYVDASDAVASGRFVPLTPQRVFDTRENEAAPGPKGELAPQESIDVQVLGVGDVPATGVSAVVINLTGTQAAGPGFITAYPTGEDLPTASDVNLGSAGTTAPNLAIVPIGENGQITIYSSHGTHVLGDITGYITDDSVEPGTAGLFVPLAPERSFDTRASEPAPGPKGFVGAGMQIDVTIAGAGNVPATAAGVVLNVTGIASPAGFLTAWETGPTRPKASTLNFVVNPLDTRANGAMLPVGIDGQVSFYTLNGSHILADVAGYFIG